MKENLFINTSISIPEHELKITTSRASGPGGQHVNKTSSRITVHWNVFTTEALNTLEKERITTKLASQITAEGDLVVHNSSSRSQMQNKRMALQDLAEKVRKALYIPKKRVKTKIPQAIQEARLHAKKQRKNIKKLRSKKFEE